MSLRATLFWFKYLFLERYCYFPFASFVRCGNHICYAYCLALPFLHMISFRPRGLPCMILLSLFCVSVFPYIAYQVTFHELKYLALLYSCSSHKKKPCSMAELWLPGIAAPYRGSYSPLQSQLDWILRTSLPYHILVISYVGSSHLSCCFFAGASVKLACDFYPEGFSLHFI